MAIKIKQFRQTVSTSGNSVQLTSDDLQVASVIITADPNNSGTTYIGDSNVDQSSRLGQPLSANESINLEPPNQYGTHENIDLTSIYIDSTSSGDAVIATYYVRTK